VLRDGQSKASAEKMLALFTDFYQGDVMHRTPHFVNDTHEVA
jgi:hypothetical protein